jgi:hypothetical protein
MSGLSVSDRSLAKALLGHLIDNPRSVSDDHRRRLMRMLRGLCREAL